MNIDSAEYYNILLSQENYDAGLKLLEDIAGTLQLNGNEFEGEAVLKLGGAAYSLDVRSLIGFAMTHSDYSFSVGGLSHVIGHKVIPMMKILTRHTESLQHAAHVQILTMLQEMQSAPK